jgi:hypothetical protein
MAAPIRRRVAAIATCLVLVFATFGHMNRTASEVAHDATPTGKCEEPKPPRLGCLILFDG